MSVRVNKVTNHFQCLLRMLQIRRYKHEGLTEIAFFGVWGSYLRIATRGQSFPFHRDYGKLARILTKVGTRGAGFYFGGALISIHSESPIARRSALPFFTSLFALLRLLLALRVIIPATLSSPP